MDLVIRRLVECIHASHSQTVIAVAGAGGQTVAWLLGVPGASRTVLEAIVPYGRRSMIEYLGHEPTQYVSPAAAREMAEAAYKRAVQLREDQGPVVGVACTATLATDRPKRGQHRCCVATRDASEVVTYVLKLSKGRRDRAGEDDVASRLVLRALAESCGVDYDLPLGLLDEEQLEVQRHWLVDPLRTLLGPTDVDAYGGQVRIVTAHPDGRMVANDRIRAAVLPGSFNPLHDGHEHLARAVSEMLDMQVIFEISVVNVDKPPLEEVEIRRRLRQFEGAWSVAFTRAPTFREKAALFPGCPFIVGYDTAVRLVETRYYGGELTAMKAALDDIRAAGCRFLVAGRLEEGVFRTLADVAVPREFADLFEAIPESRFRADISSSELRGQSEKTEAR